MEAFFLQHALKTLHIFRVSADSSPPTTEQQQQRIEMSSDECWTAFRSLLPDFASRYIAYLYFRGRGWTPKSGLKFAADYVLYRISPSYSHSEYTVLLKTVYASDGMRSAEVGVPPPPPPSSAAAGTTTTTVMMHSLAPDRRWLQVQTILRMTHNAVKNVVLCHVIVPDRIKPPPPPSIIVGAGSRSSGSGGSGCDADSFFSTVNCISQCSVSCLIVKRWVPEYSEL